MKKKMKAMNNLRLISCILFSLFITSVFALPEEPDLSGIKTIQDAKSYYQSCRSIVYKQNVTRDDVVTALWNMYYLGRWLGMTAMDAEQKYASYASRVKATTQDEEYELNSLIFRIAFTYKALQGFLGPSFESLDRVYWMNIESDYGLYGNKVIRFDSKDNIVLTEYNLNGIKFIVFHNIDKNFAYDVKVFHREKNYSKKLKKNVYKTLERDITLMPEGVWFIASSLDLMGIYFSPSSYEVKNKYYVGSK